MGALLEKLLEIEIEKLHEAHQPYTDGFVYDGDVEPIYAMAKSFAISKLEKVMHHPDCDWFHESLIEKVIKEIKDESI